MGNKVSVARLPLPHEVAVLERLQDQLLVPFDEAAHVPLLRRLWAALYPPSRPFERVSVGWKELGFQGRDPGTDVRGGGELSLRQLVFFAENHTDECMAMMARRRERRVAVSSDKMPNYPWAAAGVNITRMLGSVLGFITKYGTRAPFAEVREPFWQLATSESRYNELYCWAFLQLDLLWDEHDADYERFGEILELLRERVRQTLVVEADALVRSEFSLYVPSRPPPQPYLELQRSRSDQRPTVAVETEPVPVQPAHFVERGDAGPDLVGLHEGYDIPPPMPPATRRQLSDEGMKLFFEAVSQRSRSDGVHRRASRSS